MQIDCGGYKIIMKLKLSHIRIAINILLFRWIFFKLIAVLASKIESMENKVERMEVTLDSMSKTVTAIVG